MRPIIDYLRFWKRNAAVASAALATVACVRALLWVIPFRLLHRRLCHQVNSSRGNVARQCKIAEAVFLAARLVPKASCLTQALAAKFLLRLSGEDATLQFGVARSGTGILEAHAWLEARGAVLLGNIPDLGRYTLLSTNVP